MSAADTGVRAAGADLRTDPAGAAVLRLTGRWRLADGLPPVRAVLEGLGDRRELRVDGSALEGWDSGLLAYLHGLERALAARGARLVDDGLPEGVRRLLALARDASSAGVSAAQPHHSDPLERLGLGAEAAWAGLLDVLDFVGDTALALAALARGRARLRRVDLALALAEAGARALPITALISVLVGVVLAFIGGVQLTQFGAEVYVANLVAIGMLREMGAMMAAVIMAGRTGAAYAAEIGTMVVNEEVDALSTLGVEPMEFLVLPRVLGLVLMLPLLTVYADLLGILGGAAVGIGLYGIPAPVYLDQSRRFLSLADGTVGLAKAVVFAVVVGLAGCYHGIRCGRSSAAVGVATTRAVVAGIVLIVVTDALMTVMFHAVGL
jgi:phospholipid/cholesterol/gamma-HCH transport system permease protein